LSRPEKNNAFTEIMADELERVFTLFDVDDRVKCIVLTGAGKMFCAGADLEIGFLGGTQKDGTAGRLKTGTNTEHRDGWDNVILNTQSFWLNLV
jgi:enoyl-CoA hydratase/carnithine racemase